MHRSLFIVLLLAGCASVTLLDSPLTLEFGQVSMTERRVDAQWDSAQHYINDVKPIIENRCVVCHGCYDAPCQLKMSSPEGIMRGASQQKVYNGTRILAADPTRLGIDATSTEQWRNKGFHTVLNDRTQTPAINLANSSLYQMLQQKQQHPLPNDKILSDAFPLGLDRPETCPTPEDTQEYLQQHPLWGMPYALPALTLKEHTTLTQWIANGAIMNQLPPLPSAINEQVNQWEQFLNSDSLKQQLASRYIYEHTYLANLYFDDTPLFTGQEPSSAPEHYFKMVRSSTPPGLPIQAIASRRPYDNSGVQRVYYRLMRNPSSIVAKTHMPYRLNEQRMDWMKELFIQPQYTVTKLPAYTPDVAANPFIAFQELPVRSRYRFMLEESLFIIEGFIKGPVCRGQVALNVIDDHFWVAFVDPEYQDDDQFNEFLVQQSDHLRLPGEDESNSGIASNWFKFSSLHEEFLQAKNQAIKDQLLSKTDLDLHLIWDGDQHNPNVGLTIFRHFDSSSVVQGWVGQQPKTSWLISYPLLERIHYLLVAEFDVYGNIGHQLMTRLYMDFLRMEGEANFLTLLPQQERQRLTNYWYRDARDGVKEHLFHTEKSILAEPTIAYQTAQPYPELLTLMEQHIQAASFQRHEFKPHNRVHKTIEPLNHVNGKAATLMPEVAILYIENQQQVDVFTLIRNNGHSNITGLLTEDNNRIEAEDYLTVVPGIIAAYPASLYRVKQARLTDFVQAVSQLKTNHDYEKLVDSFGVRRTNSDFWKTSDDIHQWYVKNQKMDAGLLDYNRLENR